VLEIEARLDELRALGLYRRLRMVSGPQGPRVVLDGRPVLLLCSNNYLGLADHPRVREVAADAAMRWGVGAGASRLVSGSMTIHRRLEEALAEFKGSEACLLFGSGYLANTGIVAALAERGGVVFSDALNHASLVDGCRLARAETFVYDHADVEHLEWGLAVARAYGARLVVDEAHATGALGPGGRGAVAEAGLEDEVDVVVGTLGKALGSYGAYACCDASLARYLVNTARTLIFSTALPPPAAAGALAALKILVEQPRRVARLRANAQALRDQLEAEGFHLGGPQAGTHIVPLVVGGAADALRMCEEAIDRGVFAQAIRPPTVPEGTSRLRLAVMASHTRAELREAARVLAAAARSAGIDPRATTPVPSPTPTELEPEGAPAGRARPFDGQAPGEVAEAA
jgi:glycine C-acetyltransferase/8-amino-7-oxononanoate synthase